MRHEKAQKFLTRIHTDGHCTRLAAKKQENAEDFSKAIRLRSEPALNAVEGVNCEVTEIFATKKHKSF